MDFKLQAMMMTMLTSGKIYCLNQDKQFFVTVYHIFKHIFFSIHCIMYLSCIQQFVVFFSNTPNQKDRSSLINIFKSKLDTYLFSKYFCLIKARYKCKLYCEDCYYISMGKY